jgi:hypothetical protein
MKTTRINSTRNMIPVKTYVAESIETKVRRIMDENEPITDGAPIIYTPFEDGVKPEYNIRTDRWEVAIAAMDKISSYEASKYVKTEEVPGKGVEVPEGKQANVTINTEGQATAGSDN